MTQDEMSAVRLSSRATAWYRWGMPAVAVAIGFKLATVVRALPSTTMGILLGACGVAILAEIVRRAALLSDVWLRGDSLEIHGIGRHITAPLTAVSVLEAGTWSSSVIVLSVQQPNGRPRKVAFLPEANSAGLLPGSDDTVIRELRRRLG
jgi:hypothetical protein